jgi:hypothetical protein
VDLTLYKMAATGRINLTGLVSNRETYFTASKADDGVITLTPVNIVTANTKADEPAAEPESPPTY